MAFLAKVTTAVRGYSFTVKILTIAVLLLLLLIPLGMIRSLVEERAQRRAETEAQLIRDFGGQQVVGGPVLTVPFTVHSRDATGAWVDATELARFLPDTLVIEGSVEPQIRSRGMYEAVLYTTGLRVSGTFRTPDLSGFRVASRDIRWAEASLGVELPDMRALQERVTLSWDGQALPFGPGHGSMGMFDGQIQASVPGLARAAPGRAIPFSFPLSLRGGGSLGFLPLGEETRIRIASPWKSPSFTGSFLPGSRAVGDSGFDAEWKVLSVGRAYPQRWQGKEIESAAVLASGFGVALMTPVDSYQKVTRAQKYGVLFLILPFGMLLLFEALLARRLHPLQYLFVGLADCVFYLLLLALSEHMSFGLAYAAASTATIGMVTGYTIAIVAQFRRGILILPVLAAGYAYLYGVLLSEDYALLMGALGVFFVLAAIMFFTRRVDWYGLGARPDAGTSSRSQEER